MAVEMMTKSLTDEQWNIAHALALSLVEEKTDVNEVGKIIAYLRSTIHQPNAGANFFKYLKTLVSNGRQIGHSQKTANYYRSIDQACCQYLQKEQANAQTMLEILGWAARLMRYYEEAGPIAEIIVPVEVSESSRQAEIAEVSSHYKFIVGQILEATVTAVKGNKVTYEILGTIKLTEREPKKAAALSEGQTVRVEILELKEDGGIKKVKYVD